MSQAGRSTDRMRRPMVPGWWVGFGVLSLLAVSAIYPFVFVALTAFAEESNIKDCMESGMNHFLSKPIRRPQLKKVLKQYCSPIPEESEEATAAAAAGNEGASAVPLGSMAEQGRSSMIVVNSPGLDGVEEGRAARKEVPLFNGGLNGRAKEIQEDNRPPSPVSPFTNV